MSGIPADLWSKIDSAINPQATGLHSAPFLKSDFKCEKWKLSFRYNKRTVNFDINWEVRFGADFLTSPQHAEKLEVMKCWITLQSSLAYNGRAPQDVTVFARVRRVIRQIDYLLLNQDELGLADGGFRALTVNDVRNFFASIEADSNDDESIYRWTEELTGFLKNLPKVKDEDIRDLQKVMPHIFYVATEKSDWSLHLKPDELVNARAYLWLHGYYSRSKKEGFHYSVSTLKLGAEIYSGIISEPKRREVFDELCFGHAEVYNRELENVDVRTAEKEGSALGRLREHQRVFMGLEKLGNHGLAVDLNLFRLLAKKQLSDYTLIKQNGRYRTLPFPLVTTAIRNGIERFYEKGPELLQSYSNVVIEAKKQGQTFADLMRSPHIADLFTPAAREFGVRGWTIPSYINRITPITGQTKGLIWIAHRAPSAEYFDALRQDWGLVEAVHALYGGMQIVMGGLSARRQSELTRLVAGRCLDQSRTNLLVENAKSGSQNMRQEILRPIPPLCVEMIDVITNFQDGLIGGGALKERVELFALPGMMGKLMSYPTYYNMALDTFCDYSQVERAATGKRYYIRQHQLRRFFALTFLYAAVKPSLQTLQWFMGHTNSRDIWNYVTEQIPGDILRHVKAYFLSDLLCVRSDGADEIDGLEMDEKCEAALAGLISARFGTSNYSLIDAEALELFLELQMKRGLVLEPVFYDGGNGVTYKLAVYFSGGPR